MARQVNATQGIFLAMSLRVPTNRQGKLKISIFRRIATRNLKVESRENLPIPIVRILRGLTPVTKYVNS